MYKFFSFVLALMLLNGCSYFEFNYAICESVGPNDDPSVIEKCRNYNEEEAAKAFENVKDKPASGDDVLEFKK